eukprot:CAMPEP_0174372882 /NCGR_PEP_ID=MMETSP0811_2-20130205/105011_1 /TAXON_ID=73025 ORGANISM="Eutreptiella gymnastica-like, Strain CCMP1594" /NCGR_SAMPLE_ID=MMETSP0811_2 /ASSEMBLY_ACC=CAM_ASM_000667 /LENGTH=37 /DNA_ID= /DNA_START= /DNA_END= /DNA_ORIENTATION=
MARVCVKEDQTGVLHHRGNPLVQADISASASILLIWS